MNYKSKPEENPALQLLFMANKSIEILEDFQKLTENGKIEVLLFNSVIMKDYLEGLNSNMYLSIEGDFDILLYMNLKEQGITNKVPDAVEFVTSRKLFYSEELIEMQFNISWLPSRLYNLFYENPLDIEPKPNFDLVKMMRFRITLSSLQEVLIGMTEFINKNFKHLCGG